MSNISSFVETIFFFFLFSLVDENLDQTLTPEKSIFVPVSKNNFKHEDFFPIWKLNKKTPKQNKTQNNHKKFKISNTVMCRFIKTVTRTT